MKPAQYQAWCSFCAHPRWAAAAKLLRGISGERGEESPEAPFVLRLAVERLEISHGCVGGNCPWSVRRRHELRRFDSREALDEDLTYRALDRHMHVGLIHRSFLHCGRLLFVLKSGQTESHLPKPLLYGRVADARFPQRLMIWWPW